MTTKHTVTRNPYKGPPGVVWQHGYDAGRLEGIAAGKTEAAATLPGAAGRALSAKLARDVGRAITKTLTARGYL